MVSVMVRENRIPLNLSYGEPNDDSSRALQESDEMTADGTRRYEPVDEVFDAWGI